LKLGILLLEVPNFPELEKFQVARQIVEFCHTKTKAMSLGRRSLGGTPSWVGLVVPENHWRCSNDSDVLSFYLCKFLHEP